MTMTSPAKVVIADRPTFLWATAERHDNGFEIEVYVSKAINDYLPDPWMDPVDDWVTGSCFKVIEERAQRDPMMMQGRATLIRYFRHDTCPGPDSPHNCPGPEGDYGV